MDLCCSLHELDDSPWEVMMKPSINPFHWRYQSRLNQVQASEGQEGLSKSIPIKKTQSKGEHPYTVLETLLG